MAILTNQSGTNLGPLTTTWTMPETCSLFIPSCSTCAAAFRAQSCDAMSGGVPKDNTACWPPAKTGVTSPAWPFTGWGFYSPGLACPSGYLSACTAVQGGRSDWANQFSLVEGETAIGCCPTGFACANNNGNTCVFTASTTTSLPTADCDGTTVTHIQTHVFPDVVTEISTATNGAKASVTASRTKVFFAPMFQLNFKSSDIPASSTSFPPTTRSTLSTTLARDGTGPGSGSGLGGGVIAGICVGVACGLGLILFATIFLWRRRRAGTTNYSEQIMSDVGYSPADPNAAKAQESWEVAHEIQGTSLVELPAGERSAAR